MIKYIKGDIFTTHANIIAHGVNCKGGFGSGIAGQIAKKFPIVKEHYLNKFESRSTRSPEAGWDLGEIQIVYLAYRNPLFIINCATQNDFGKGICHAEYPAIKICMEKVKEFAKDCGLSIAIPKIGCGLAGGDWNIVEKILIEIFDDYDILVYEL